MSIPTPPATSRPAPSHPAPAPHASHTDGGNGLARTVLLALAIIFLVLALVPWREVLYPRVRPNNATRFRVAFMMISLSVGFGYVIASYLNGSA